MTDRLDDRSDGDLAGLALAGQQAAFAAIVRRHKHSLHRLVARLINDDTEAVDVVQDVFVSAFAALPRYDHARPMRAWLARIAINKSRDWRRRRIVRRAISTVFPLDRASGLSDQTPGIDVALASQEELRLVAAAIDRLPARLREVLVLRTIDGLTQAEAAQVLGIGEKAAETRLYRARQKLSGDLITVLNRRER